MCKIVQTLTSEDHGLHEKEYLRPMVKCSKIHIFHPSSNRDKYRHSGTTVHCTVYIHHLAHFFTYTVALADFSHQIFIDFTDLNLRHAMLFCCRYGIGSHQPPPPLSHTPTNKTGTWERRQKLSSSLLSLFQYDISISDSRE